MGTGDDDWLPRGFEARASAAEPGDAEEWSVAAIRPLPEDPPARDADPPQAGVEVDLDRISYEELRACGLSSHECLRFLSLRERARGLEGLSPELRAKLVGHGSR